MSNMHTYTFSTNKPFISCTFDAINDESARDFYTWYKDKHRCKHASLYRGKRPSTSITDLIHWQENNRILP